MSKFIKLSNYLININYIHSIHIKQNKYILHFISNKYDGFNWNCTIFGFGSLTSSNNEIVICENKNSSDFKIISDWIANQEYKLK